MDLSIAPWNTVRNAEFAGGMPEFSTSGSTSHWILTNVVRHSRQVEKRAALDRPSDVHRQRRKAR
jgi:hypothetical protein